MFGEIFGDFLKQDKEKYNINIMKRKTYPLIKEFYDNILIDYLNELKEYTYKIYEIKEYQKVIAFDCGHITYISIEPELLPAYYDYYDDYERLCTEYNIVIADLVMSHDYVFKNDFFIKNYEFSSKLFNFYVVYPNEDINNVRRNSYAINLFEYVNKQIPEINIKEKFLNNKKINNSIENNESFSGGLKHYNELYKLFTNDYLSKFNYKVIDIKEYEKIIIVENDCILFFYMDGLSDMLYDGTQPENKTREEDYYMFYKYIIQELTYNNLFKFNMTKFYKQYDKSIAYYFYNYAKLYDDYLEKYSLTKNRYNQLNNDYPELKLEERNSNWKGIQYYFIVYELTHNGVMGTGVTRTTNPLPTYMGRTLIKEYENYKRRSYDAFYFDDKWFKCMDMLIDEAKQSSWENVKTNNLGKHSLLAEKVNYYVVPIMLKDTSLKSILTTQNEVLKNAINGKYREYERHIYDIVDYKWKSEELVYECVKKIFKNKTVIHQYRPYYLGQLSYDVFVCGLDIAFEYQGKQHFEPVEIFGGQENFEKQQERDLIKKELSEDNNVTLIYINYWEDITIDLIKEKLKEHNIVVK